MMERISVYDDKLYKTSVEVLNECFGKQYKGFQRAFLVLDSDYAVWFPRISTNSEQPKEGQGWRNTMPTEDMIREECLTESLEIRPRDEHKRYTFKKYKDGSLKFVGIFMMDQISGNVRTYKRVSDYADLSMYRSKYEG